MANMESVGDFKLLEAKIIASSGLEVDISSSIVNIVIYEDTGHVEAITVFYNSELTSYEELLKVFWENIDPFDSDGQFCDKGKSYRSVAFYETLQQKQFIQSSMLNIEKKFNKKKVVTLVWKFEKFYPAEDYHQDYYQNNFLRYLAYKKRCQREEILNKIWN